MDSSVVEAGPACSKPAVGVGMRIPTGERHDLDASACWSTRASLLHLRELKVLRILDR